MQKNSRAASCLTLSPTAIPQSAAPYQFRHPLPAPAPLHRASQSPEVCQGSTPPWRHPHPHPIRPSVETHAAARSSADFAFRTPVVHSSTTLTLPPSQAALRTLQPTTHKAALNQAPGPAPLIWARSDTFQTDICLCTVLSSHPSPSVRSLPLHVCTSPFVHLWRPLCAPLIPANPFSWPAEHEPPTPGSEQPTPLIVIIVGPVLPRPDRQPTDLHQSDSTTLSQSLRPPSRSKHRSPPSTVIRHSDTSTPRVPGLNRAQSPRPASSRPAHLPLRSSTRRCDPITKTRQRTPPGRRRRFDTPALIGEASGLAA